MSQFGPDHMRIAGVPLGPLEMPPSIRSSDINHSCSRRAMLYRPWTVDMRTFEMLRARGLPTTTALFLSDTDNRLRTVRAIYNFSDSRGRRDALDILTGL